MQGFFIVRKDWYWWEKSFELVNPQGKTEHKKAAINAALIMMTHVYYLLVSSFAGNKTSSPLRGRAFNLMP